MLKRTFDDFNISNNNLPLSEEDKYYVTSKLGDLEQLKRLNIDNIKIEIIKRCYIECCKRGYTDIVKYLYENKKEELNKREINNEAFLHSSSFNHMELSKWLYENLDNICVDLNDNWSFRRCCKNGYLKMAKWLYSLYPEMKIYALDHLSLKWCASDGKLETLKWLYSLNNNIPDRIYDEMMFFAIKYKNQNIIDWLLEIKKKLKNIYLIN
jgi:hypothetical protein